MKLSEYLRGKDTKLSQDEVLAMVQSAGYGNQNAFSNVQVGAKTVSADGKTDTVNLVAGSNVQITADPVSDTITISATDNDNNTWRPMIDHVSASNTDKVVTSKAIHQALQGRASSSHSHSWPDIASKPKKFPPSSHSHPLNELEEVKDYIEAVGAPPQVVKQSNFTAECYQCYLVNTSTKTIKITPPAPAPRRVFWIVDLAGSFHQRPVEVVAAGDNKVMGQSTGSFVLDVQFAFVKFVAIADEGWRIAG